MTLVPFWLFFFLSFARTALTFCRASFAARHREVRCMRYTLRLHMMMRTARTHALALLALASLAHCTRSNATPPAPPAVPPSEVTAAPSGRVAITVDNNGYHPSTVHAAAGRPLTLVFTRTADEGGCGERVVFAEQHIDRELPPNQPVEITVTPSGGRLAFACGMNMYRGAVVVQ